MKNDKPSSLLARIDSRRYLVLGLLFVLALGIRLYFTWDEYQAYGTQNWADATIYLDHGQRFAAGDFYPAYGTYGYMIVGPVMPLLVALAIILTGDPIYPMLILNCLLSSLLLLALFHLGRRLVNVAAGYILALWATLNFGLIRFNFQILKEPLVFLLVPLIVICLLNVHEKKKPWLNVAVSSLLFLILIHTDERYVIYAPAIFLLLLTSARLSLSWRRAGLWLVIVLLGMLPWTLRNFKEHDQLVILTPRTTGITSKFWGEDLSKLHFAGGNAFKGHPKYDQAISEAHAKGREEGVVCREYGKYEKYWKAFWHYWKPAYFRLTFIQYGFRGIKWSLGHNLSSILFHGVFLPFYLAGCALAFIRRRWHILLLAGLPLFHSLVHTFMIWPLERYRLPLDFLVALVALWFLAATFSNRQRGGVASPEEVK